MKMENHGNGEGHCFYKIRIEGGVQRISVAMEMTKIDVLPAFILLMSS
jgi:hypothetical protein